MFAIGGCYAGWWAGWMWDGLRVAEGDGPWDFFISYTQADRGWAEWIAWELEEAGRRVLVQAWDFVPGSNWIQGMQVGVSRAGRTIAVLSDDYLESVFGGAEWQAAWAAIRRVGAPLLPVRVADCDRPGLLGRVVGVDLFGVPEAKARARLRTWWPERWPVGPSRHPARFPAAGRAMPVEPRFPGALPRSGMSPRGTRISPAAERTGRL